MAFNQTEKQEKEYLKQIISFLKKVIGNTDVSVCKLQRSAGVCQSAIIRNRENPVFFMKKIESISHSYQKKGRRSKIKANA